MSAPSYTTVRVWLWLIGRIGSMIHDIEVRLIGLRIVPLLRRRSIVDYSSRTLHVELFRR